MPAGDTIRGYTSLSARCNIMLPLSIWIISLTPLTSAVIHSLQYFYTATSGISRFPEFTTVGKVDDLQISYYDSTTKETVPKQDWMKEDEFDPAYWSAETEVAMDYEQTFKADMSILKDRFNQTGGVHVFQKMYGCQWDDETGATHGFEQFGYDGEDFMSLDLKNMMWIAVVYQASPTRNKWNNNEMAFPYRREYFEGTCVEWLKKYIDYGDSTLQKTVRPEVSLLQKGSEVACHATGFYPEEVMITWKKDGVEMEDDVDVGETLPNEDGTFQKRAVLTISPEERKKAQYSCEVTHRSGEPIVRLVQSRESVFLFHEQGEPQAVKQRTRTVTAVTAVFGGVAIGSIAVLAVRSKGC